MGNKFEIVANWWKNLPTIKKVIILIGFVTLLVGSGIGAYFLFRHQEDSKYVVDMAYNKSDFKEQVIHSTRQISICQNQLDVNKTSTRNVCTNYTTDQNILVRRNDPDTLLVYVIYQSIEMTQKDSANTKGDQTMQDLENDSEQYDQSTMEQHPIFRAKLTNGGNLLSLDSPNGPEPDILARLTERLIQQSFPQIEKKLYQNVSSGGRNRRMLIGEEGNASNTTDFSQSTYLGFVDPSSIAQQQSNGTTQLIQEYNNTNFKNFTYDLGGQNPDIAYSLKTEVGSEGHVHKNNEDMSFNLTSSNQDDTNIELIGSADVSINSQLEVNEVKANDINVSNIVKSYEDSNAFQQIDLSKDGGMISFNESKTRMVQQTQAPVLTKEDGNLNEAYKKTVSLFQKKLLGQIVEMKASHTNYQVYSSVDVDIFLNNSKLMTVIKSQFNHPYLKCKSKLERKDFALKVKIFQVAFPVLAILSVTVGASAEVDFGFDFYVKPTQQLCTIGFDMHSYVGFEGTGGVTIPQIVEGGISVKGSLLKGSFDFNLQIDRLNYNALLLVSARMIPFELSINAYYKYMKCEFVKVYLWRRSLRWSVKNIVKAVVQLVVPPFVFTLVCAYSDATYINLYTLKIGGNINWTISKEAIVFQTKKLL